METTPESSLLTQDDLVTGLRVVQANGRNHGTIEMIDNPPQGGFEFYISWDADNTRPVPCRFNELTSSFQLVRE